MDHGSDGFARGTDGNFRKLSHRIFSQQRVARPIARYH